VFSETPIHEGGWRKWRAKRVLLGLLTLKEHVLGNWLFGPHSELVEPRSEKDASFGEHFV
jgi:hypothetical protein